MGGKESVFSAGNAGPFPVGVRSPEEGNGNPLQYSFLGNLMDRGAWGLRSMGLNRVDTTDHTHDDKKESVID